MSQPHNQKCFSHPENLFRVSCHMVGSLYKLSSNYEKNFILMCRRLAHCPVVAQFLSVTLAIRRSQVLSVQFYYQTDTYIIYCTICRAISQAGQSQSRYQGSFDCSKSSCKTRYPTSLIDPIAQYLSANIRSKEISEYRA